MSIGSPMRSDFANLICDVSDVVLTLPRIAGRKLFIGK